MDPVPDPLLLRKSGSAGDRTRDLCICSQKLLPLDHRGGPKIITQYTKDQLWFLDVLIKTRMVILLGHMMYGNPHIHAEPEHFLEQKWAILLSVIRHVGSICNTDGTDEEIRCPSQTSNENEYSNQDVIHTAFIPKLSCRHRMENLPEFYPCHHTRILPMTGT